MNKETLKELIEIEFERSETISQFKKEVFRLIDLYEIDSLKISISEKPPQRGFIEGKPFPTIPCINEKEDKVPYWTICSCNPQNGGSGICWCVMGNKMVSPNSSSNFTTNVTVNKNEE